MKAYYYTACVSLPKEPYKYFKAYNKKQIKKYLTDNFTQWDLICDPVRKPIHGIYYIDVTEIPSPK